MKSGVLILAVLASSVAAHETSAPAVATLQTPSRHFDHILVIVLENQAYVNAIKDTYLKQLADQGANFTDFHGVEHPSYPNYLAMIAGSTFGMRGIFGDSQQDFLDDTQHKTLADSIDWKNYAENYPTKPS